MDFNYFLYYGQVSEADEIQQDLIQGVVQPQRSLFYHRSFGAGVSKYENLADGLALQVGIRYDVASWIARRNSEVSDGSKGTRDRRVVTSQTVIQITGANGVKNVMVPYLRYSDAQKPEMLVAAVGL